jgi:hypothetical protein
MNQLNKPFLEKLRKIGRRPNVLQIVPPRHVFRPAYLRKGEDQDHELANRPLASPTGPNGAGGFANRGGSQIAVPAVTNIYMGAFWGDRDLVEGFSKAILENGYLDPLQDLNYGTGPGTYVGGDKVAQSRPLGNPPLPVVPRRPRAVTAGDFVIL